MIPRKNPVKHFLDWLGGHELAVLLSFAGIAAGLWMFAAIANAVIEGDTAAFDRQILIAMRRPVDLAPVGPPALQDAARDITALGGPVVLFLITATTGIYLFLAGRRHMALFVYGSVVSGLLASTLLKDIYLRPRPDIVPQAAYVMTTSFPSGHSMLSAVTYLTLAALLARSQTRRRMRAFFLIVAGTLSFLVGLSRVYLGVHWPTDVLAGWTAGGCWAVLCWLVARVLQRRRAVESSALGESE